MLLDSRVTRLVISSEFVRKYKFKKKKLDRPIYIKNIGGIFNYKELIKYIVEVELFYQEHKERMEIDMIRSQKSSIILEMLWLAYYNPEINQKTEEVKMTRYLDKYKKQQKTKQTKLE